MLILLSPAKSMDTSQRSHIQKTTIPPFDVEAHFLASKMTLYGTSELMKVLKISHTLAQSTFDRYIEFNGVNTPQIPALLAYTGSVFKEIKVSGFSQEEFEYSQNHLRIISVLYGLLRPLDAIKAYRMEYKLKLDTLDGDIYKFWHPRLTRQLIDDVMRSGGVLVNLAGLDILPALDIRQLEREVLIITPEFKSMKNGKYENIRTYTKIARGAMSHYILKNEISNPEQLKEFEFRGYKFNAELSTNSNYIFTL